MSDVRHAEEDNEPRSSNWMMTPLILLGVLVLALLLLYQAEISAWISGKPAQNTDNTSAVSAPRTDIAIAPENVADKTTVAGDAGIEVISAQAGTTTPENTATATTPLVPDTSTTAATSTTVITPSGAVTEAPSLPPVVEAKPAVKPEPTVKAETKTEPKKDVVKVEAKPKPAETKSVSNSADEQALLAMNSNHFAVQIMALSDEKAVKQFVSQQALKKAKIYRAVKNGKTIYFLVQIEYADHAAAEKARDALPEAVRKLKPWVKQLSVIQQEIKAGAKAR